MQWFVAAEGQRLPVGDCRTIARCAVGLDHNRTASLAGLKNGSSGICGNDNRLKANANSIHLVVTKQ
jgi:hypothetical protein